MLYYLPTGCLLQNPVLNRDKTNGEDMRVVKEAEERKNEILDVAERLFGEKGFDNTSTNDILEEIGIARGTLYYHFKSKELTRRPNSNCSKRNSKPGG